MCLSFIISATAADTLKRVPSTIPGTDKEYNYVENITVKIPGTNVTFDFEKVASFILVDNKYPRSEINFYYNEKNEKEIIRFTYDYSYDIPVYRFTILESGGRATINQDGTYAYFSRDNIFQGSGNSVEYNRGEHLEYFKDSNFLAFKYSTVIDANNACHSAYDLYDFSEEEINDPVAVVEILCVNNNGKHAFDDDNHFDERFYELEDFNETIDISLLDVNYKPNEEYKIIDGANSVVNSDTKSLIIRIDAEFSKFTGVTVDGKAIDSSNYTASEGSTIVEFKGEYLSTLSVGEHTVTILFTDGEATTQFEIKRDTNNGDVGNTDTTDKTDNPVVDVEIPNTDGGAPVPSVFAVMALGGMALITFKKKK